MTKETLIAITEERAHQKLRWGDDPASICEYATYIRCYADELTRIATHTTDKKMALDTIRKIAALGIACMEENGVVFREKGTL